MKEIDIISYKHDGSFHRVWQGSQVIYEDNEMIITINNKVRVIDSSKRKWKTKDPAVCFFYKNYWFNVIAMIKNEYVYYYCNLSSPFVLDEEGLKYIDYDLDIKLYPDRRIVLLDKDEYDFNKKQYDYPKDIEKIINNHKNIIINKIENYENPFLDEYVFSWYFDFFKK